MGTSPPPYNGVLYSTRHFAENTRNIQKEVLNFVYTIVGYLKKRLYSTKTGNLILKSLVKYNPYISEFYHMYARLFTL